MELKEIIYLILLGLVILSGVVGIIYAIVRGEVKKFVVEKMQEAENRYKDLPKPAKSKAKLEYVIKCVSDKYKLVDLFLNVKKFVEKIIEVANSLQRKG